MKMFSDKCMFHGKGIEMTMMIGVLKYLLAIREIPDHATFRGKGVNTGLVRQTWGLSLFGPM